MKNYLLIIVAVLCLFGCGNRMTKMITKESNDDVEESVSSKFRVEKRAGKVGLLLKGKIVAPFDYDSINLTNPYPVLTAGLKKYLYIDDNYRSDGLVGPFDEINQSKGIIKVSTDGYKKNGFYSPSDKAALLFDYPVVEQEKKAEGLYWVWTQSGQQGLISRWYGVDKGQIFILPIDNYLRTKVVYDEYTLGGMVATGVSETVTVEYYKKDSFGEAVANNLYDRERTENNGNRHFIKEKKLSDICGSGTIIINISKLMTALVYSKNGYGLVNIKGVMLVPARYKKYQLIGDYAYAFSSDQETIKVNLEGKRL